MLHAGYKSGPSNMGLTVPIGSTIPYKVDPPIFLTASHILKHIPPELPAVNTEIKPVFINLVVGIHTNSGWELFLVNHSQEILPEVTALYLEKKSVAGNAFPKSLGCPISRDEPKPMRPVHVMGYPASIQSVGLEPDPDLMEVTSQAPTAYHNIISGTVSAYYPDHCPEFIPKELLPAFTIDNAVIPGMSGGAVLLTQGRESLIVGMVIKNLKIIEDDYHIVHSIAVATNDITI